jgi:hypothetical protein
MRQQYWLSIAELAVIDVGCHIELVVSPRTL